MRLFPALLLIFSLALVPAAFAAQKPDAKAPVKTPDTPAEQIYLDVDVDFDEIDHTAYDKDGVPISGTIQSFYPNGRLAWATQWVEGKLHGVTRGYRENRKLKEETTWVNGKLHGPARWYDEKGRLIREIIYEDGKDPAAPAEAGEQDASAGQDKAPEESPQATDAPAADAPQP
ncbi:MAG: hypothetical protein LBC79_06640 [Deltaproteobacteria bacterium]|jgi:hypothetical protein|nr:hypothetical protein [Deltaproteobacteria bacterium]